MNITSNSQLLASLNGLIDPNQRQQQQALQDQQQLKQKDDKSTAEQTAKVAQESDRQTRIDANRDALKKLQDRLKADKIEKLKSEFSAENAENQDQGVNLNLRENLGGSSQPIDTRPGQIVDIRV